MKFNKKRITSLGALVGLALTLTACSGGENNNSLENSDNKTTIINGVLSPEEVLTYITPNDEPMQLKQSFLDENNNLVYQDFGPKFFEKNIDGLKYLINADTNQVCLSGYSNLGRLCCLKSLQPENGGTDSALGYSGYVLLAIYNVDGKNLFSLYDFDDFTPLLEMCDLSASYSFSHDIFYEFYIAPYDPKYRGNDDENAYAGYCFEVKKDDICYLVDANDFNKIVLSGDYTLYDINVSSTGNATISYYNYSTHKDVLITSEDLVPYNSHILQKRLTKKNED